MSIGQFKKTVIVLMTAIMGRVHVNNAKDMLRGVVVRREEEVRVVSVSAKKSKEMDM